MELYNTNLSSKIVKLLQPKNLMVAKNKKKKISAFLFTYFKNYLKISKKKYRKRRGFLKYLLIFWTMITD